MNTLKTDINPRFQLADIRAFTLPSTSSSTAASSDWSDLGLRPDLTRALVEGLKLKKPLPAQVSGIPAILKIKTGLFAAPTGCGKTLSYLLPLFQHLKNEEDSNIASGDDPIVDEDQSQSHDLLKSKPNARKQGPRALILVPTHELVRQVYSVAKALSHYAKLRVETIDTVFKFKKPEAADSLDILVTTPRSLLKNQTEAGPFKSKRICIVCTYIIPISLSLFRPQFSSQNRSVAEDYC